MKRQFIEQQMLQHAGRMAKNQSTIVKAPPPEEIVEEVIEETKTNEEEIVEEVIEEIQFNKEEIVEEIIEETKTNEIELSSPKKKQKITSTEQ